MPTDTSELGLGQACQIELTRMVEMSQTEYLVIVEEIRPPRLWGIFAGTASNAVSVQDGRSLGRLNWGMLSVR